MVAKPQLNDYENYFQLVSHSGAQRLARQAGINDPSLIPPMLNLVRSHIYLQTLQEMAKTSDNGVITYTPHFMRAPVVEGLYEVDRHVRQEVTGVAIRPDPLKIRSNYLNEFLNEMESMDKAERERHLNVHGIKIELDLPILTAVVLESCKSKGDIMDSILTYRNDPDAKKMRGLFNKFRIAVEEKDYGIIKECHESLDNLKKDLQIPAGNAVLDSIPKMSPKPADETKTYSEDVLREVAATGIPVVATGFKTIRAVRKVIELTEEEIARRKLRQGTVFLNRLNKIYTQIPNHKSLLEHVFGK